MAESSRRTSQARADPSPRRRQTVPTIPRSAAPPSRRDHGTDDRRRRRIPWTRRIGAGLAIFALGGSIVLGSGSLDGTPTPSTPPAASAGGGVVTAPSAPTILAPTLEAGEPLVRERSWTATGTIAAQYVGRRGFRVRVYRDGKVVAQERVTRGVRFVIEDVPLRRGSNVLTARVSGPDGESGDSAAVTVVVDDQPPGIAIDEPIDGDMVNAATARLVGSTQAGTRLTFSNVETGRSTTTTADGDGAFAATVPIELGPNTIAVRAVDPAGNAATTEHHVIGGEGRAEARLTLSDDRFRMRELPAALSMRVVVSDADGELVDGAAVVFTLSPPGLPTSTYRAVTERGEASWLNVDLPAGGAVPGEGFATVSVDMPDGTAVRDLVPFSFYRTATPGPGD